MNAQHVVVRASAGTGKTTRLVEHYLQLVHEHGIAPERIVAITFTRKAAAELRHRIVSKLQQSSLPNAGAAGPMDTFHGLCLRLQHDHALWPDGGTTQEIYGENDEDAQLFARAAHEAWFGPASQVAGDVAAIAANYRFDTKFYNELYRTLAFAREEGRAIDASLWSTTYRPFKLGTQAQTELSALHERLCEALGDDDVFVSKWTDVIERALIMPVPQAYVQSETWTQGWRSFTQALPYKCFRRKAWASLGCKAVYAWPDRVEAERVSAQLAPRWQRLVGSGWQAYEQAKRARHALDFADVISLTASTLASNAEAHAAVRAGIDAVLVDEAQDTNRAQRQLVRLLAGFEGPAAQAGPAARLFVVGDAKQCIYSFRGSDVESFERFADDVLTAGGASETLPISYRPHPRLLRDVNAFGASLFRRDYEPLSARPDGACAVQPAPTRERSDLGGNTNLLPLPPGIRRRTILRGDAQRGRQLSAQEEAGAAAQLVADAIRAHGLQALDIAILRPSVKGAANAFMKAFAARKLPLVVSGGAPIWSEPTVAQWVSLLAWLADPSQELALAVALRGGLLQVHEDLLWAALGKPGRELGAVAALRCGDAGPWLAALPPALRALHEPDAQALASLLAGAVAIVAQGRALESWLALARHFELEAHVASHPFRAQIAASLAPLRRLAERDQQRGGPCARTFFLAQYERMQRNEAQSASTAAAASLGAATLTTIHTAKGLEWPYVVVAGLTAPASRPTFDVLYRRTAGITFRAQRWRGPLTSDAHAATIAAFKDAKSNELRRLAYVAVTRAKQRVDLLVPDPPQGGEQKMQTLFDRWNEEYSIEQEAVPLGADEAKAEAAVPEEDDEPSSTPAAPSPLSPAIAPPASTTLRVSVSQWLTHVYGQAERTGASTALDGESNASPARAEELAFAQGDEAGAAPAGALAAPMALDARLSGTVLHEVIAGALMHPLRATTALAQLVERCLSAAAIKQGVLPSHGEVARLREKLRRLFASPAGKALTSLPSEAVRCEYDFEVLVPCGRAQAVVHGKLDLLATRKGIPWIVDFKAGKPKPSREQHALQVQVYAWALRELTGYGGPIDCSLVYLGEWQPHLHEVPAEAALLHRAHESLKDLVHQQMAQQQEAVGQRRS